MDNERNRRDNEISIEGLDPATLLMELHNGAHPHGMGTLIDAGRDMTIDDAHAWIEQYSRGPGLYVDFCQGRPILCELTSPMMRTDLYDRESHPGACAEAVERARTFEQAKIDAHQDKIEAERRKLLDLFMAKANRGKALINIPAPEEVAEAVREIMSLRRQVDHLKEQIGDDELQGKEDREAAEWQHEQDGNRRGA